MRLNQFLFIFIIMPCYSMGNTESSQSIKSLKDMLIEKKYEEVIKLVPNEILKYPDQFDKYQNIISQIVDIKGKYNNKMYEILEKLANNPEDEKSILNLANDLIALDPNAEATIIFIQDLKENISFSVNKKALNTIFESSSSAMSYSYRKAFEVYLSVFNLNREEMIAVNHESIDSVLSLVSSIESELLKHIDLQEDINNTIFNFILNYGALLDEEVKMTIRKISDIYQGIEATKENLYLLGTRLLEFENYYNENIRIKENNNIRFIYTAIFGKTNYGIINSINIEWYNIYMNFIRKLLFYTKELQYEVLVEYKTRKHLSTEKLYDLNQSIKYIESFNNISYKDNSENTTENKYEMLPDDIRDLMESITNGYYYIINNAFNSNF